MPDLGHVLGEAGAVLDEQAHLLHLGEGPPIKVGRAHVEMLPVHQPQLNQRNISNHPVGCGFGTHFFSPSAAISDLSIFFQIRLLRTVFRIRIRYTDPDPVSKI